MIKNNIKYLAILALGLVACEPEFDNPLEETTAFTSGEADFSNYVALGNSLTAGYADGALYVTGQENSYPNILSKQFAFAGGGEFTQPLMSDNTGGGLIAGVQLLNNRLVLAVVDDKGTRAPRRLAGTPTTEMTTNLNSSFNNMGIPSAKSYELLAPGYGSAVGLQTGTANPYFVRFASSPTTTVLEDALEQDPSFFSLWIGSNDVLLYALEGGVDMDHNETGNTDPSTYMRNDITNTAVFDQAYTTLVDALTAGGRKGVLLNLPDVTSIPFFTTVPNNALVLSAEQAANLTGFFQAFAGIATQVLASPPNNIPLAQAQAIAAQYAIQFNPGPNKFLIKEESPTNPFGFRQMTDEELLLLTIDQGALGQGYGAVVLTDDVLQVLGILQMGGTPTPEQGALVIGAVNAIDDKDVLDAQELASISNATTSYNATIKSAADTHGLAFVDAKASLAQVANGGIPINGGVITSQFGTGGGFSLDGVHPTPRGYALIANLIMDAIKSTYKSNLPKVDPADFGTITVSNDIAQ